MRRLIVVVLLALSAAGLACNQREPSVQASGVPAPPSVRYGANSEAGGTFMQDAVTLYYEVYGAGGRALTRRPASRARTSAAADRAECA